MNVEKQQPLRLQPQTSHQECQLPITITPYLANAKNFINFHAHVLSLNVRQNHALFKKELKSIALRLYTLKSHARRTLKLPLVSAVRIINPHSLLVHINNCQLKVCLRLPHSLSLEQSQYTIMKVEIVHNSQKLFNVNVTEKTTIGDLKQVISHRIGMAPKDQVLALKGIFMEDSRSLGDYQLPRPDVVVPIDLFLPANYKNLTPIRVSLDSDRIVSIAIRLDAKVSELRSAIEQKCDILMKRSAGTQLIFDQYILNDNETLDYYGIKRNSRILVVKRLPSAKDNIHNNGDDPAQSDDTLSSSTLSTSPKIGEKLPPTGDKIKLTAMNPDSSECAISFDKDITLQEASERIEHKTGIPAADQRFKLKEDVSSIADMSKTLEQLGLSDGDNLYMVNGGSTVNREHGGANGSAVIPSPPPRPFSSDNNKMVLIFRDAQHEFTIPLPFDATVMDAMDALRAAINGSPGPLWLRNADNGNYMNDYVSHLSELGVKDRTVIEYVYLPAKAEWAIK
ncbi:hypothetical protein ACTXT7_005621 [Hymenolepis weldensis]